ncbi:hypothetical protein FA13DRAFT_1740780 [Coprinellus micaceus]|uniref:Uncharacterized protein n=1 Tax=Coprinellus micaceus TaxID=71717 RepID=A0A4Y7SLC7_COPMI|nr:hypothetical protein FA13DRAFT_1740780 [Coprinellus micaceus]
MDTRLNKGYSSRSGDRGGDLILSASFLSLPPRPSICIELPQVALRQTFLRGTLHPIPMSRPSFQPTHRQDHRADLQLLHRPRQTKRESQPPRTVRMARNNRLRSLPQRQRSVQIQGMARRRTQDQRVLP